MAEVAARRHAFEGVPRTAIEDSGLADAEDALVTSWEDAHLGGGPSDEDAPGAGSASGALGAAALAMAGDFSPARLRCIRLTEDLALRAAGLEESPAAVARGGGDPGVSRAQRTRPSTT